MSNELLNAFPSSWEGNALLWLIWAVAFLPDLEGCLMVEHTLHALSRAMVAGGDDFVADVVKNILLL
jgi:hypothetical protein